MQFYIANNVLRLTSSYRNYTISYEYSENSEERTPLDQILFTVEERNYSAQELEGLALYRTINHFSFYLHGKKFVVYTDHKGLLSIKDRPQGNRKVLRWTMKLMDFSFELVYRKGTSNTVADWLSRRFETEADEANDRQLPTGHQQAAGKEEGEDVRALSH